MVHRKLNRTAGHRMSLLRNLVTNLFEHESIVTTYAKAKEAQTAAERIITKAKRADPLSLPLRAKQRIMNKIYKPDLVLPKLLSGLRERYQNFNGGYTRVLRLENRLGDNAPQAILELVGGKRDMRMAMTARIVARYEAQGTPLDPTTRKNVAKVCRGDPEYEKLFRNEVEFMKKTFYNENRLKDVPQPPQRMPFKKAPIKLMENPLNMRKSQQQ